MIEIIDKAATVILTIWGIFEIPTKVFELTKSMALTITSSILILLFFSLFLMRQLFPSIAVWRAGYGRFPTKSIITTRSSLIVIDNKHIATVSKNTEMIFMAQPKAQDLVDMIETHPSLPIEERHYSSTDATIKKVVQRKKNILALYWEPTIGELQPLIPYNHQCTHVSPSEYGPFSFFNTVLFDRPVGEAIWEFQSFHKVSDVIAFIMPLWSSAIDEARLYYYGFDKRLRNCSQPKLVDDGNTIHWSVKNAKFGRKYVLFAIYKGCEREALEELRSAFNRDSGV